MHIYINLTRPGFHGRDEHPDDGDEWIRWDRMAAIVKEHNEREARREQGPDWILDVADELRRARAKFPKTDLLTTAFAEEAGELVKAILDGYNGKPSDIYTEAIQTIAMVVRLLEEGDPVHRLKPIAPVIKIKMEPTSPRNAAIAAMTVDQWAGRDLPFKEHTFPDSTFKPTLSGEVARLFKKIAMVWKSLWDLELIVKALTDTISAVNKRVEKLESVAIKSNVMLFADTAQAEAAIARILPAIEPHNRALVDEGIVGFLAKALDCGSDLVVPPVEACLLSDEWIHRGAAFGVFRCRKTDCGFTVCIPIEDVIGFHQKWPTCPGCGKPLGYRRTPKEGAKP